MEHVADTGRSNDGTSIGEDTVYDPTTHPSILEIKNHVDVEKNFEFQHITSDKIEK